MDGKSRHPGVKDEMQRKQVNGLLHIDTRRAVAEIHFGLEVLWEIEVIAKVAI
jgi:hypothetical protein